MLASGHPPRLIADRYSWRAAKPDARCRSARAKSQAFPLATRRRSANAVMFTDLWLLTIREATNSNLTTSVKLR
jgi:hypothetical protein